MTGEGPQRGSMRLPRVPEECPQASSTTSLFSMFVFTACVLDCLNESLAIQTPWRQPGLENEGWKRRWSADAVGAMLCTTRPSALLPTAGCLGWCGACVGRHAVCLPVGYNMLCARWLKPLQEVADLIERCMRLEVSERPTAQQLMQQLETLAERGRSRPHASRAAAGAGARQDAASGQGGGGGKPQGGGGRATAATWGNT